MPAPPILLVSQIYPPAIGGSGVLLENVYARCAGIPVTVMTDTAVHGSRVHGAVVGVVQQPLATPHWGLSNPAGMVHHLRTALAIRRQAARLGPGATVHCGRVLPEGVAARLAAYAGGPRFSCWVHGEDLATAQSSRELTAVTRWVLRAATQVYANSRNTQRVAETFGVEPARITVAYPGVDAVRFHPDLDGSPIRRRHGLAADALVALSVGRLQARKGHDVAIQALAAVAPEFPVLKYLIVGNGDERARLEGLVAHLHLADRVIFAGEVAETDLPAYFAACDVFLLPNRVEQGDFEGFGIVFLEAAAVAKPVIGGSSGGVVEAVADGETGLLVDGADVAAVAAALRALASSPERRRQLGAQGRVRAARQFTWDAAAAKVAAAHGPGV
ncbi:MAG TPA: glycosyltransferase family 4 protein [Vicinamibacterales bacterium]|nr:glycosyltransferase family 4 protein [Vicinamibacterales bacterium]